MKIKNKKTGKTVDVRLPKAFKEKWLKALRSGKYIQGEGNLEATQLDDEGNRVIAHCCLGVACRMQHPKLKLLNLGLITEEFKTNAEKKIGKLKIPKNLIGSSWDSDDDFNKVVEKLTSMNDNGKSFKYIANYIEKNL